MREKQINLYNLYFCLCQIIYSKPQILIFHMGICDKKNVEVCHSALFCVSKSIPCYRQQSIIFLLLLYSDKLIPFSMSLCNTALAVIFVPLSNSYVIGFFLVPFLLDAWGFIFEFFNL